MGKKRSLRPRLSQSAVEIPRKKTKLKGKSVTKPKEVVRNDGETSAPLTAAEKVGKNMDLMNLIVRNIDKVSERKNIAESCKAFNVLCNSKESYAESFKYGNGESF